MADDEKAPGLVARTVRRVMDFGSALRRRQDRWLYEDDVVRLDSDGVVVRRYYWPLGWKRIPYADIEDFTARPLKAWHGQHRVHGIDHRGRWYSRDSHRGEKELAIDLDVGRRLRPVLTPEDPDTVLELLEAQMGRSDTAERDVPDAPPDEGSPETWLL